MSELGRAGAEELLSGWGRTSPTSANVTYPTTVEEIAAVVGKATGRGVLARGLGRSYGDAAQNAGGDVLDMTSLNRIHAIDADAGIADVDAGVSLDALMRAVVPLGWFVAVTPGTRYVTVGGAIASDVHGKNHHVEGSFAQHVVDLDLLLADGSIASVGPDSDVFWATAGGMGLTGIIVRARIRLLAVRTPFMLVDTERARDLDDCMAKMLDGDDGYRYSVAWIDLLARGAAMGRSVLTRGDHAELTDLPKKKSPQLGGYGPNPRLRTPALVPPHALNRLTVRAFNELWFRKAPRQHTGVETIPYFFHPLDGVLDWNRIYGRFGFVQYQYVVPDGRDDVVRETVRRISDAQVPTFLAVLKRFGEQNDGMLSFPMKGWTLALDVPTDVEELVPLFAALDEMVVAAGGRVYLSKDSRLAPDMLETMYPRLAEWRDIRNRLDPQGVFVSDLDRRVTLA